MQEVDGISFLVGMTVLKKSSVPACITPGWEKSYWVEDGVASPMKNVKSTMQRQADELRRLALG